MAGSFKRYADFDLIRNWHWHYSGTFFWFRNADVFQNQNWCRLHPNFTGQVEAWPAGLFPAAAVACLFGDDCQHLYEQAEVERWEQQILQSDLGFFRMEVAREFTGAKWAELCQIHGRLVAEVRRMGCATVLELGSGLGPFLLEAKAAGLQAVGIDRNQYARDFALSQGVEPLSYLLADLQDFQIESPVDCIVTVEVFEHLTDQQLDPICRQLAGQCKWFYFTSTPHADAFDAEWGHCNLKSRDEWIAFFGRYGLEWHRDDGAVEAWGMVFRGLL